MFRIVLCYPVQPPHLEQIRVVAGQAAEVVDAGQERVADELLEADIYCGHAKVPVDWDQVVQRGQLQWIQSSAAGLDHCLVPAVVDSAIVVTGASGLFAQAVSEHTMALVLAWLRSLPVFFRAQQQREFVRRPTRDLAGRTVGIVGFGGNGRRLAQVLAPYGVAIVATDMFPGQRPDYVHALWPADRLPDLLRQSDVVVLCVPLTDRTRAMINAQTLQQMKQGSLLVNVARGPVVVERDLVAALQGRHLAGAALDVTEIEPLPLDSPLWQMPNVIITPHVGAQSADRLQIVTDFFCENLRRFLAGFPLHNVVDKRLGFPVPPDAPTC